MCGGGWGGGGDGGGGVLMNEAPGTDEGTFLLSSAYTGVLRFSSLREGGTRSSNVVKLVEWIGLWDGSSGPRALCRGGRVEHRALALERGC